MRLVCHWLKINDRNDEIILFLDIKQMSMMMPMVNSNICSPSSGQNFHLCNHIRMQLSTQPSIALFNLNNSGTSRYLQYFVRINDCSIGSPKVGEETRYIFICLLAEFRLAIIISSLFRVETTFCSRYVVHMIIAACGQW